MTEAQKECLDKVENLLGEHFDSYVVCVDNADINDAGDHYTGGIWHGGHAMAAGLCELQKARIVHDSLSLEDL